MGLDKERKTGLSLQFFKNTWFVIGVFAVISVMLITAIVMVIGKNGNNADDASATVAEIDTKIKMGNRIVTIPALYNYKLEEDGSISLTDEPGNWVANILYRSDIMYEDFEANLDATVDAYKNNPGVADVSDSGIVEVGEREYFYIDVVGTEGSLTGSYVYTGMGNNVLEIVIETSEAEFRHDLLDKLAPIINGITDIIDIENNFADTIKNKVRVNI